MNSELLGVLDVQSPQVGAFGSTEQMVLEALAARLPASTRPTGGPRAGTGVDHDRAATGVAETIARHDDQDDMLDEVGRLTPILTGVNISGFCCGMRDSESYYGATPVDAGGDEDGAFARLALPIGEWGALDANPTLAATTYHDQRPALVAKIPAAVP